MWVRFPNGTSQVSIEQQTFHVEHEDKEGNKYFQVPDHFAPTILDLLPGFRRVDRPEGAPEDIKPVDPQRAEATDKLAARASALVEENDRLRQELGAARRERDGLQTKLDDFEAEAVAREQGADENEQKIARATGDSNVSPTPPRNQPNQHTKR
jgi:hypothetical protein